MAMNKPSSGTERSRGKVATIGTSKRSERRRTCIRTRKMNEANHLGEKVGRHYELFEELWETPPAVAYNEAMADGNFASAEKIQQKAEAVDYWWKT